MRNMRHHRGILFLATIILAVSAYHCSSGRKAIQETEVQVIETNIDGQGATITVEFRKGKAHNHPLMAIWLEDTMGHYIESLYVAQSIGRGTFKHGDLSKGFWQAGPVRRPAALPYWSHKWGVQAPDGYFLPTPENPLPDAITGPTPQGDFKLVTKASKGSTVYFVVLMEINQPWDWNEHWTNTKYPDDIHYRASSQPSLVYAAEITVSYPGGRVEMKPLGHGHYSGMDGKLYTDLGTMNTALDIIRTVTVDVSEP